MNDEHPDGRGPVRHRRVVGPTQDSTISLFGSKSWIGWPGITVEIACLYTSCECASRRNRTQKLSNQVIIPWSLTPLTRKMVTGVLFFLTWFKNTSCTFCDFSGVMGLPPLLSWNRASPVHAKTLGRNPPSGAIQMGRAATNHKARTK